MSLAIQPLSLSHVFYFKKFSSNLLNDCHLGLKELDEIYGISEEFPAFSHLIHCVVRERKNTSCWENWWVGDRPLYSIFLCLFYLSSLKNYVVFNFLVW